MKKKKRLIKKLNDLIRQSGVPRWLHHFGPKTYTSWQHLKAIFLKEKLKCSYKDLLEDFLPYFGIYSEFPDVSTLKKFAKRIPLLMWNMLLQWSAQVDYCLYGAIDATGISRTSASGYYLKRIDRDNPIKKHLKLSLMVDVERRKFLSAKLRAKPVHDTKDVKYLVKNSPVLPEINLLDKGYDDNKIHTLFREQGVCSLIPPRNKDVPIHRTSGIYRKEMKRYFDHGQYWLRNLAETLISCIKKKYGNYVKGRSIQVQRSEVYPRLILHNISLMIARLFHLSLILQKFYKLIKIIFINLLIRLFNHADVA